MSIAYRIPAFSTFAALALFMCGAGIACIACSSTIMQAGPGTGATPSGPPDQTSLPPASAGDLGQSCGGGTGVGETALFQSTECGAGFCLVDATTGLDNYCSADCTVNSCPAGYACRAVDHPTDGYGCFKDPNAKPDTPPPAPGPLDIELDGYQANATSRSKIKLRDYQDATRTKHDVVFVTVLAPWSASSRQMNDVLSTTTVAKVAFVQVLVESQGPGVAATLADLDTFHGRSELLTVVLDPELKTLSPLLGPLTAVPAWTILDAKTLVTIESSLGSLQTGQALEDAITEARAKLK